MVDGVDDLVFQTFFKTFCSVLLRSVLFCSVHALFYVNIVHENDLMHVRHIII